MVSWVGASMWFEAVLHLVLYQIVPVWLKIWYLAFSFLWNIFLLMFFPKAMQCFYNKNQEDRKFNRFQATQELMVLLCILAQPQTLNTNLIQFDLSSCMTWHEVSCHPGRPDTSGWSEAGSTNLICFFRLAEGLISDWEILQLGKDFLAEIGCLRVIKKRYLGCLNSKA